MSSMTSLGMYSSQGSMTSASIIAVISTNGVMPT